MKRVVLMLLGALAMASAHASEVVAVLSGDAAPYKEALAGLQAVVGPVDSAILPALPSMQGAKVVVAFGGEAAIHSYPSTLALVAALLPDPKLKPKHGGNLTRVALLPDASVLIAKLKALDPGLSSLAAFDVSSSYSDYLAGLKAAGAAAGVTVDIKKIETVGDLVGKLPGLKGSVQALWLPPDPLIMNPKTFGLLSAFCSASKIALVAPVAALARAGAFAGISPSFKDVGTAAGKASAAYVSGANPAELVYPAHVETVLNTVVAASIGVDADSVKAKADSVVP